MSEFLSADPSPKQLFRQQASQLVAALVRLAGLPQLAWAETITARTAAAVRQHGAPTAPATWAHCAQAAIAQLAPAGPHALPAPALLLSALRTQMENAENPVCLLLAICDPAIEKPARLIFLLKIFGGFDAAGLSTVWPNGSADMDQQLASVREVLAEKKILFDITPLAVHLDEALATIEAMFDAGFWFAHAMREAIMETAMRLVRLLTQPDATRHPNAFALLALLCFEAARSGTAPIGAGQPWLLIDAERTHWNQELIWFGKGCLDQAAEGNELSRYHLQAGIAFEHSNAETADQTDWENIRYLYDLLYPLHPVPEVALNRALAIGQTDGPAAGIRAIEAIENPPAVADSPWRPAMLSRLYRQLGQAEPAAQCLTEALGMAQSAGEKAYLLARLSR